MHPRRAIAALLIAALCAGPAAFAQTGEPGDAVAARQSALDALVRDIEVSEQRKAELRKEIEALEKDRAGLNQALIDTGKRAQGLETAIGDTERRIGTLAKNEAAVHASLMARRDVLSEVLAALQRMGHRPPPAILVRPEDALGSVRSAILLGAVVPDLRGAANKLAADLQQLVSLRAESERERNRLLADATTLADQRERIELLLAEKRKQRTASAKQLADEEARAAALAEQASTLRDLIATMESKVASAAKASAEAEKAAASARENAPEAKPASLGAADRLAPAIAFADARGLLPLPASGAVVRAFGEADGLGAKAQGVSVSTRSGAQVVSPTDGWIVYAGPFRSYGQLLIINAGGGYHVLLAGMERIDVQLGQFVLAGEPVAVMAMPRLANAGAADIGATQPLLYIEFRKDGNSIDPAPWWAVSSDEKVGG